MYNKNTHTIGIQIETRLEVKNEPKIIFLINSMHYLLEYVMIVFEEENYRLVVNRFGEIVTDENYKTLRGAKIAFLKFHGLLASNEKIRSKWSHIYKPDKEWLEQRLKGAPFG
jgi:hypothetical protein